jgi:hypothetical protein
MKFYPKATLLWERANHLGHFDCTGVATGNASVRQRLEAFIGCGDVVSTVDNFFQTFDFHTFWREQPPHYSKRWAQCLGHLQ